MRMNKNLRDYVKVYNLMSPEFCLETINQLKTVEFNIHKIYNVREGKDFTKPDQAYTYYGQIPNTENLTTHIRMALTQYILKDLNFEWFPGWEGFSYPMFNRYHEGQSLYNHCDHIHNLFEGPRKGIPKVSAVGVLNDDFDGGEFVMFDDEVIPTKAGDIVVFPSVFLYPHKVNKVISGERYTFASWVW
jgi:predicted 2-oxoglutarate/Fe(II)-dependent dioxygenase YbiX